MNKRSKTEKAWTGLRRGCGGFATLVAVAAFLAALPAALAETPLDEPRDEEMPGEELRRMKAADQALRFGFSSVAAGIYRSLAEELAEEDPRQVEIRLGLVTALVSERDFPEAEEVLSGFSDTDDPRYLLRKGTIALAQGDDEGFAEFVERIEPGELPDEEQAWALFLTAIWTNRSGDVEEARELYDRAIERSPTPEQVAAFSLEWERSNLLKDDATERMADELKRQMDEFEGRTAGYRFAQQYAVVLEQLGERNEASSVIRSQLQEIPAGEREIRDQFLLLDGMISGADSGQGRSSLRRLLENGGDRELQRVALKTLSATLPGGEWAGFDDFLAGLIDEDHPLVEELLVFRAQLAIRDAPSLDDPELRIERFEKAIENADSLLTRFPGSGYKREALEVLAAAAWEQRRYRTAASYLNRLRDELPAGTNRAELGLLVADCYFRAGEVNQSAEDFRNAADAYGSAMRELPEGVSAGKVLFHRVSAEIKGGRIGRAEEHLEGEEAAAADPFYRWRAEWNLVKAMQREGSMMAAYERIHRLLDDEGGELPDGALKLRLMWLHAQLSYDAGMSAETLSSLARLEEALDGEMGGALSEGTRARVDSHALLLRGRALLAEGDGEEAVAVLEKARSEHEGTEPAIYSYLVEARHYTNVGRTVDAQQLLVLLADTYQGSPYAAIALYEAALNAERRGHEENYLEQAISHLERLVSEHPEHELAFYARLRQGDLLRQLNRFEAAEVVYQAIENRHPGHPDMPLVQLSLADCHLAQADDEASGRFSSAISILERLYDLPGIAPDLRVEAGFKLAFANARRGRGEEAAENYWTVVSDLYLDEEAAAGIGSRGRYWIARSLFEYGRYFEGQNRKDEARRAYLLVQENGLPGRNLAAANLARLESE